LAHHLREKTAGFINAQLLEVRASSSDTGQRCAINCARYNAIGLGTATIHANYTVQCLCHESASMAWRVADLRS
jgi:hypothetical protein